MLRAPPKRRGGQSARACWESRLFPTGSTSLLVGLVDGQLGRRIGFETIVGDWAPTQHGKPESASVQALLGAVQCIQPVPQPGQDRVAGAFRRERLGPILPACGLVPGGSVRPSFLDGVGQQGLYPRPLSLEQLPRPLLLHVHLSFLNQSMYRLGKLVKALAVAHRPLGERMQQRLPSRGRAELPAPAQANQGSSGTRSETEYGSTIWPASRTSAPRREPRLRVEGLGGDQGGLGANECGEQAGPDTDLDGGQHGAEIGGGEPWRAGERPAQDLLTAAAGDRRSRLYDIQETDGA